MGHHKRKRPKKQRAGCLFCKPHKGNGQAKAARTHQENWVRISEREWRIELKL